MGKGKDPKDDDPKAARQERRDERQSWFYNDYDLYDWSGKQTDNGAEVRRKGSDR